MNFFQITLGSFMKRRGIASHKLLSVLVNCQTPNNVFAQGREKLFRSGPIYTSVPRRETRMNSRAAHTKTEEVWLLFYVGFSWAPSGMAPYSKYCQSATNSLRASATMPIRRTRLLPLAKRF